MSLIEQPKRMSRDDLIRYQARDCEACGHPVVEHRQGSCMSDDPQPCWCDGGRGNDEG